MSYRHREDLIIDVLLLIFFGSLVLSVPVCIVIALVGS